jgi:hypothetical protein
MLGLRDKLRGAPFLRDLGIDVDAFLVGERPAQKSLLDPEYALASQ